jgi:putative N6-adenine-specific DNA methylase
LKLIAKTLHGLEQVLAKEIELLGGKEITILRRAVAFEGDQELLYKANYLLRTAIRILKPIYKFEAKSDRQLYHKISSYNWAMHFDVDKTFAISSSVHSTYFNHSQYVALKTKDAMVDQFRNKLGKRPSVDTVNPDIWFNVHCYEDEFTISLDSSGNSLHRRGYRDMGHLAPLNEVLASGMLHLAEWNRDIPLLDPMCGTGTILLEAAMMGSHTPAGFYRKDKYCFQNWTDYDNELFQEIKIEAQRKIDFTGLQIKGGDNNPSSVRMTQETIDHLGFNDSITVERKSFKKNIPEKEGGLMMTNPPYGERLQMRDINQFYKDIGDTLKKDFAGWNAWIISSNFDAMKNIGLKSSKRLVLFNGSLECKFQKFSMYSGTKKVRDFDVTQDDSVKNDSVDSTEGE